jgi:diadenosine tetraphosphate (Ap4A) HIT family hydrolase
MQLLARPAVLQSIMLSLFSFPLLKEDPTSSTSTLNSPEVSSPKGTFSYHEPPAGVDYSDNGTVFGKILRGEESAETLGETCDLLAFEDLHPRAPLHALIIPKRFIGSVFDLSCPDVGLVEEMQEMAYQLLQEQYPNAYRTGDYILCFHIPPFNSVDHLHLHVLAPASQMGTYYRFIKYQVGARWCTSAGTVVERLRAGKPAVPYQRPSRKTPLWDLY